MPQFVSQSFAVHAGQLHTASQQDRKLGARVSVWPVVLVLYAVLLPREMSIHVGQNFIYMDRLALLFTVPLILRSLWRGAIKFVLPDWLVLGTALWIIISTLVIHGIQTAAVTGVSLSFDAVVGYYLARISFRSLDDIRRALILCAPGFFLAATTVMLESITHHLFVRQYFASIFGELKILRGGVTSEDLRTSFRLGLLRGMGPWVHPILAGLHLSTLLGVYWMSGIRGWPKFLALCATFMAIFSVSSSAFISLALQIACLSYDWLCKRVGELNWRLFTMGVLAIVVSSEIFSNRGFAGLLITFATLDPASGFFRQLIWEYGIQSVYAHPLFGIGFNDYVRPVWMFSNSVDAHWLLYAMRYGAPAAIMLMGACLSAIFALARSEAHASPSDARFYRGIIISFATLILMAFTVALQGGTLTWFTILLGACVACAQNSFVIRKSKLARRFSHASAFEHS